MPATQLVAFVMQKALVAASGAPPRLVQLTGAVVPPAQALSAGHVQQAPLTKKEPALQLIEGGTQVEEVGAATVPGQHERHELAPEPEKVLAGQDAHEVLADALEKKPGLQLVQLDAPGEELIEPGAQATHTPPELAKPAAHVMQAVELVEAAPEPGGQTAHVDAPARDVKVPLAHAKQIELPVPDVAVAEPAGHGTHPDEPEDDEIVPGGHERHTLELVAPAMALNVLIGHATHAPPER